MHAEGIVIFDVDGTLSCTSEVDDRCWMDAAAHVIGVRDMSTDWSTYSHSTDEAIATDLIRDRTDLEVGDDVDRDPGARERETQRFHRPGVVLQHQDAGVTFSLGHGSLLFV